MGSRNNSALFVCQICGLIVISLLSLGLWPALTVRGAPPLQAPPPRPELPEPGQEGGGGVPGGVGTPTGGIYGTVINWSFRNEPGATVRLNGGSWELQAITDDNGYYALQGIGEGICFVNPLLPENSGLKSMTSDLALKIADSENLVVNLGLYSSQRAPTSLPVRQTMTVMPGTVMPGDEVAYTIKVFNKMPHGISQVIVTDYLPDGLIPLEATTDHGQVEMQDNLVVARIGEIAEGGQETVTIMAQVAKGVHKGVVIENRASLIYRESVATQSTASVTVGEPEPTPAVSEKPKEEAKTKPDMLPETGLSLPLAALGLAALLILSRKLRK